MYLPPSQHLNIDALSELFSEMSESYKLFWFNSIMEGVAAKQEIQSFDEIVIRMAAEAWPLVMEHKLSLGPSDGLEALAKTVAMRTNWPASTPKELVLKFLKREDNKEIRDLKKRIVMNVPYRLLAPFMPDVKGDLWKKQSWVINRINQDDSLIYSFGEESGLARTIKISSDWMNYLHYNQDRIVDWIGLNMLQYLQRRNPDASQLEDIIRPYAVKKTNGNPV